MGIWHTELDHVLERRSFREIRQINLRQASNGELEFTTSLAKTLGSVYSSQRRARDRGLHSVTDHI